MRPALIAFVLCVVAAALESVAAGGGVKARFAQLRLPRLSPPLTVWIAIGVGYYVMCFVILSRLLAAPLVNSAMGRVALGLTCALMLANAAWGLLFFRRRNLRASFLAFPPYVVLTLALGAALLRVDRIAAMILAPYLLYLVYATWWGYRLWRLNEPSGGAA